MSQRSETISLTTGIPLSALIGLDDLALDLLEQACRDDGVKRCCVQYPGAVRSYANSLRTKRLEESARAIYVEEESLKEERRFALEIFKSIMRHGG